MKILKWILIVAVIIAILYIALHVVLLIIFSCGGCLSNG